jgi:hypothetical protein
MQSLRRTHWFLSQQLGIDLRRLLRMPAGLWRFLRDWRSFRRGNKLSMQLQPCLHDWWQQAGAVGDEYFWQDLMVARMIHRASPRRHVDVGSRLDGFVAHVASFRDIDVFDVRPLDATIPGVTFRQADMMSTKNVPVAVTDSLSCLHAIEHFGLGRYGDPIEHLGVELGISNLAKMLEANGRLYLSCPVGRDVVHFNAHRALEPARIDRMAQGQGLVLEQCHLFDVRAKRFEPAPMPLQDYRALEHHSLAVFVFRRPA